MVFYWNGITFDDFLIQGLNITSPQEFAITIVVIAILSTLYEGVRTCRDLIMNHYVQHKDQHIVQAGTKIFNVKYSRDSDTRIRLGNADQITDNGTQFLEKRCPLNKDAPDLSTETTIPQRPRAADGIISSSKRWLSGLTLLAATILHMINVCLGYTLMLAVMTFNGWILCAILCGTAIGYFIFSNLKQLLQPTKRNSA